MQAPVSRAVFAVVKTEPICRVEPEPTFSPVELSCAIERNTVTVLNGWVRRVGRDCEDSLHRMDFSAGEILEIRAVEQGITP